MLVTSGHKITEADLDDLAALANAKLLPVVNAAIAAGTGNWQFDSISYAEDGTINSLSTTLRNIYDIFAGPTPGAHRIVNPQPAYTFDLATKNWHDELNRLRGDLMYLVLNSSSPSALTPYPGAENIFLSPNAILSGPWVVGVNDPVTFTLVSFANSACLFGALGNTIGGTTANVYVAFKNVQFYFVDSIEPTINTLRALDEIMSGRFGRDPSTVGFNINFNSTLAGTFKGIIKIAFHGSGTPPIISGFTFTNTGTTPIIWSIETVDGSNWNLVGTMNHAVGAGAGTVNFTATSPSGYVFNWTGNHEDGFTTFLNYSVQLILASVAISVPATGISAQNNVKMISAVDMPANSDFVFNGVHAAPAWSPADPTMLGVWVAKTLPVPGRNIFCDQDMPQFLYNANGNTVSSMRQVLSPAVAGFNPVLSARPASPTPYQVLRDIDLVSFDIPGSIAVNNTFAGANGTSFGNGSIEIGPAGVSLKLLCVASGSGGKFWKNGAIYYGTPLPVTLRIYVSANLVPDPTDPTTYDFFVDSNNLDLPPNGPPGYFATILNGGFNYTVVNNSPTGLRFDVVEDYLDGVIATQRQYLPPGLESFSYCIDGLPRKANFTQVGQGDETFPRPKKSIPQSGYTIFRLRATRLPVVGANGVAITPTAGAAIPIVIGTWQLQVDQSMIFVPFQDDLGNPFTVTIPANARDSGDAAVFWPVLSGNQLVYHCTEQIILEAWVDWQPIFHNRMFGYGFEFFHGSPTGRPQGITLVNEPTAFQYALGFENKFDVTYSEYPAGTYPPVVQYPITAEVYNDLWNLLNLI